MEHKLNLFEPVNDELTFSQICKKIESDPNYKPGISDDELLKLAQQNPGKTAWAIQDMMTDPKFGKFYQIKFAGWMRPDSYVADWDKTWCVKTYEVILVSPTGKISNHDKQNIDKGIYDRGLSIKNIDQHLGYECLHPDKNIESQNLNY